jgi:hypothetical protein
MVVTPAGAVVAWVSESAPGPGITSESARFCVVENLNRFLTFKRNLQFYNP